MKLAGTVDYRLSADLLGDVLPRQVPYAAAAMVTALARDVNQAVQEEMPKVFDQPTDFTLRGVRSTYATKDEPSALVYIPQSEAQAGKGAREYLRPETQGASARYQKKTEFLLARIGALPPGWVTTPGKGAELNAHGNIGGPVYKQIINVLQIRYNKPKPVSQRSQKVAKKLGVQALFFAVAPGANTLGKNGGWLPPGVWKHLPGGRITQILKFVRKAAYRKRLDLVEVGNRTVQAKVAQRWAESITAITARWSAKGRTR